MACFAYFRIFAHMWDGGSEGELISTDLFFPQIQANPVSVKKPPKKLSSKLFDKFKSNELSDEDCVSSVLYMDEAIHEEINMTWHDMFKDDFKWDCSKNPDEEKFFEATGAITVDYWIDSWTGEGNSEVDISDFIKAEVTKGSLIGLGIIEDGEYDDVK